MTSAPFTDLLGRPLYVDDRVPEGAVSWSSDDPVVCSICCWMESKFGI